MGKTQLTKDIEDMSLDEIYQAMTPKRRVLLDNLPDYAWDITKAGLALGYKTTYATDRLPAIIKHDVLFCKAMSLTKAQTRAKTGITLEWWTQECLDAIHRCKGKGDETNAKGYMDMLARHIGSYEADNHQRGDRFAIILR